MQAGDERFVLRNARCLAADYMTRAVRAGDTVVDATMGNGKDTLFLCGLVGESGYVYAFDVQAEAVARTRERVAEAGYASRTTLLLAGHETMAEHVAGPVQAATALIAPGGIVTVCVYPGHEEGARELEALRQFAAGLDVRRFNVLHHRFVNASSQTPQLFLIQKNKS